MRREDVFELRPVDERLVELRVLARRVAEDIFHTRGHELFGEAFAAAALDDLEAFLHAFRALRMRDRHERVEDRTRRRGREAGGGEPLEEGAPRDRVRQVTRDELSHWGFFP